MVSSIPVRSRPLGLAPTFAFERGYRVYKLETEAVRETIPWQLVASNATFHDSHLREASYVCRIKYIHHRQ